MNYAYDEFLPNFSAINMNWEVNAFCSGSQSQIISGLTEAFLYSSTANSHY